MEPERTNAETTSYPGDSPPLPAMEAPFLRAPERARTVFLVTFVAGCFPLLAGGVFFGWRTWTVAGISIFSCLIIERLYYRVTRLPALLGRTHGILTGLLIALTLPAWAPWYVPVVAAAFAIILGKAIFGGVGHFLWQPALVGRLAVGVIFPAVIAQPFAEYPDRAPLLARNRLLVGDIRSARRPERFGRWADQPAPAGVDAFLLREPSDVLDGLTSARAPAFSSLAYVPAGLPQAKPAALSKLPPMQQMILGARPGAIGETSALVIVLAGLYLAYRNYIKLALPASILLTAAVVFAAAPVQFAGPNETVVWTWWPVLSEGLDVGMMYVCYQLLSFELILAAFFLAPEMTSRPVTTGGQVLFGLGCGALAVLLKLYLAVPIPAFTAVLAMNTLTPVIDRLWQPRVLGQKPWWRFARKPVRSA